MSKTPSHVQYQQNPRRETTGHSSGKHPSELSYQQNPRREKTGHSSKKNSGHVTGALGKEKKSTGHSSKKNQTHVPYQQNPRREGSAQMPVEPDKSHVPQKKATKGSVGKMAAKTVGPAPKFTSIDSLMSYRKKKYGA